jgi:hypothetical protein
VSNSDLFAALHLVCFWPKADILIPWANVCFGGKADWLKLVTRSFRLFKNVRRGEPQRKATASARQTYDVMLLPHGGDLLVASQPYRRIKPGHCGKLRLLRLNRR